MEELETETLLQSENNGDFYLALYMNYAVQFARILFSPIKPHR